MQATQDSIRIGHKLDMEQLARAHYERIYRFCASRIGAENAADAAQETFVTAHRVKAKYRGDASVLTWLLGIAHNECRRWLRSRKAVPVPLELSTESEPRVASPEAALVDRRALSDALARLSEEHREVVILHEIEGLRYEEIAGVLGVPVGTVKSRLHHAFGHLRKAMFGGEEDAK